MSGVIAASRPTAASQPNHYTTDDGLGFVFDLTTPKPLLRFDGRVEAWVLTPTQGPGGDTLYKNEMGETMLRLTRVGGMTVFTPENSRGSAAEMAGRGPPLGLVKIASLPDFDRAFYVPATQILRAADIEVSYHITFPDGKAPLWSGLVVDAAYVMAEKISLLSKDPAGRKLLAKVKAVDITLGQTSSARLSGGTLTLTLNPDLGMAGRPSSDRIEAALR